MVHASAFAGAILRRRHEGDLYGFAVRTATRSQRDVEVASHSAALTLCRSALWGCTTQRVRPVRQVVDCAPRARCCRVLYWSVPGGEAEAGSKQRSLSIASLHRAACRAGAVLLAVMQQPYHSAHTRFTRVQSGAARGVRAVWVLVPVPCAPTRVSPSR